MQLMIYHAEDKDVGDWGSRRRLPTKGRALRYMTPQKQKAMIHGNEWAPAQRVVGKT